VGCFIYSGLSAGAPTIFSKGRKFKEKRVDVFFVIYCVLCLDYSIQSPKHLLQLDLWYGVATNAVNMRACGHVKSLVKIQRERLPLVNVRRTTLVDIH
jgi:hypothetical protein